MLDKTPALHENPRQRQREFVTCLEMYMTLRMRLVRSLILLTLTASTSASADALEDILESGTIRVAVAEFVPWTMKSETGELTGFEIDVANKIARDMGVKPEFKVYDWDGIIAALERGEVDVIAGGMAITPARALRVNFSRPLATDGVGLATNIEMTRDIETLEQLNDPDITIATVKDTLAHSLCKTLFGRANIATFTSATAAEKEVVEGRAHAYLASIVEARFLALRYADEIDLPISEPLLASTEALAVKKGEQELLNYLNAWVTARRTDKWVATTRDYWFETLDWTRQDND